MLGTKTGTYKAMGFVEALIAIMIAGIASIVLMNIAASALKEAVQNERIDKMTEYAVEGGNMVRSALENSPPAFTTQENCYIPIAEAGSYTFYKQSGQYWLKSPIEIIGRDNTISRDISFSQLPKVEEKGEEKSDFFRIACIRQNATRAQYLIVRIGIAHIPSSGKITNDKEMKDYFYTTTINL